MIHSKHSAETHRLAAVDARSEVTASKPGPQHSLQE